MVLDGFFDSTIRTDASGFLELCLHFTPADSLSHSVFLMFALW